MDKNNSSKSGYRVFWTILLVSIFSIGTILSIHQIIETTKDLCEILQDGENDIKKNRFSFGNLEEDELQILVFNCNFRLSIIGGEFNHGVTQFTPYPIQVVTPPPEFI
ncbi:MAG: hypothetical protein IPL46_32270 [Saprospiraceae bacterium]|nr:hypothetical protein [Saprospiraceae bacterium]